MSIWLHRTMWGLMLLLSLAIGSYAVAFFFVDSLGGPEFKSRFATIPWSSRGHIILGGLCLMLGSLQFSRSLRVRFPLAHRWTGRAYLSCVMISGIGALFMAPISDGGPVAHVGFGMLAVVWLYSGANAYLYIRARNIKQHQRWMIRNFALTLAAVTLRLHLPMLQGAFGLSFEQAYPIVAWLAWVPNLLIAEWFILATPRATASTAAGQVL